MMLVEKSSKIEIMITMIAMKMTISYHHHPSYIWMHLLGPVYVSPAHGRFILSGFESHYSLKGLLSAILLYYLQR